MAVDSRELWHQIKDGKRRASAVKDTCQSLEKTERDRRNRWIRNTSLYENRPLAGLNPDAYFTTGELTHDDWDVLRMNIARMLVNSAHAKIAGKQKPKTQFVVTNGDWSMKRKAKKQERINEALMLSRQGSSSDAWEQTMRAQIFAMVGDLGVVKTTANVEGETIDIRAYPGYQFLFDPVDAMDGQPLSLFHVYPVDAYKLAAQFPQYREAILDAPDLSAEGGWAAVYGRTTDISRIRLVREAWRLHISDKDPGVHAVCVGDVDIAERNGGPEPWKRSFFPCEFYVWEQFLQGMCGTSIVDNVYQLTMEYNASIQRMSDAERVGSNQMAFVERNSVKKEELESNIAKVIVEIDKGAMPPVINTPNAISQSSVNWSQLMRSDAHDVSGVSEMAATGEKQPGVEAASAIRLVAQLGTERFSVQWQAYERRTAVGQARQNMAALQDLVAAKPDFKVKLHGDQAEELKATDFILDEDKYIIQPYPVPGSVNGPADRVSLGNELYDRQMIGPQALSRIHESKDTPTEIASAGTWAKLFDRYIESWLDATRESEARGAEGDPTGFRYRPPIKWMPLTDAIVQVGRAFAEAEMEGADDYNLQFFIRFLGDCDREIEKVAAQQMQQQQAAQAAAAPPVPPGGVPPMATPEPVPPGMLQ